MKKVPFMSVKGSDPNAPMKGDHMQALVPRSTAPGTKPRKPPVAKSGGQFTIPKARR